MIHINSTDSTGTTRQVKTLTSDDGDQINHNADTGQWDAWHSFDGHQVTRLTPNTAATAVLRVYANAAHDALRVDYTDACSGIYPAGQWPVLTVTGDLFDQPSK